MSRADPASTFQQALLSYRQGDWPNAKQYCREALQVEPDHPGVLQMLAVGPMRQAKPAQSVSTCDRLLKRQPNLADAWNNHALALQDLGKPAEAIRQRSGEPPADFDVPDEDLNR